MLRSLLVVAVASLPLCAQATVCQAAFNTNNYLSGTSTGGPNLMIGIKVTANATYVADRLEIFTGLANGANGLAIWSDDAANNRPLAPLGSGSWQMSRLPGWQGANLSPTVSLTSGQTIWIVWSCVNGSQSSLEGTGAGAQQYRGSFDNGATWSGPFQSYQWKLRIWCGGAPGSYEQFGSGCAGSTRSVPTIGWDGIPDLGTSMSVLLGNAPASTAAFFGVGDSNTSWLGNPLPYNLAPYGAPQCRALASVVGLVLFTTNAAGSATATLTFPNQANLLGYHFYDQWWVLDQTANALGFTTSDGGAGVIGF